ncbi:unnamed protein product [Caenorhabditis angaria]|uniref:Uncharacterized protein n=1 Tax=Caenorhabditis angaria TaxID=860376 RepID=A0A9P1INU9_9PELO|nr:unnamed protein product [Caenorhabditis angaria]
MAQEVQLIQLQPNMNGFNTTTIVLDPGQIRRTQQGSILTMKVADQTGSINATYMNPDFSETWKGGDILRMKGAYTSVYQGGLTLAIGRNGDCKKIGEFFMQFSELPDISQMALPVGTTVDNKGAPQNRPNTSMGRGRPSY